MVTIQIYTTFTPHCGENSDLHHAMVKIQIYTTTCWKFRFTQHFYHAVVKIQIYTTFTPGCGENSNLNNIYSTPWWKFRFTWHLHHTMVKIQIYMTFTPCHGENSDLHDIFTTHAGIFMTKFTPLVVKIDFYYKIYTTCGKNSYIYTTCGANCHSNGVVNFSVISKIGPTLLMSQLQLKIFQYVVKIILLCHLVLKILDDTDAASSVLFKNILYLLWKKKLTQFFLDTLWLSLKINTTLWRFGHNPLRIDWDIDEKVQFCSIHRVVGPCWDRLETLSLLCESLETIHSELTETYMTGLNKMCSFAQGWFTCYIFLTCNCIFIFT